ncbi:hypothetical protein J0H58_23615, partial [bacterium]|nr:hypothetical protein [bacterium]
MSHTPHDSETPPGLPRRVADDDADGIARHPTQPSPSGPPARAGIGPTSDTDVLPLIDGYVVVGKIGEGGMGAVYLAEDARLGRRVAIKTMRRDLAAGPPDRDRFLREARVAAAVESDHLVPVWGVGEAADGTPFLVMPFLRGEPLDARLRREPVSPPGLVLKVAGEVAEGLA